MRIVELRIENIKRISAVSIKPDGSLVEIAGKNGQGKSSILDSIYFALAGERIIERMPIRAGQERARIMLDCGEIVVTRTFNAKEDGSYTTALKVESPDGARFPSPQKMLDALMGELSFDPLEFEQAKPDERFDRIRTLLPGIDFDATEKANGLDFAQRTEVGRRAKELTARANAILADMSVGDETIDIDGLTDQLANAAKHNGDIEQRKNRRDQAAADVEAKRKVARQTRARAEELRQQADEADALADRMVDEADKLDERLAMAEALPEPLDVDRLRHLIGESRAHNAKVEARRSRLELFAEAKKAEDEADALTKAIDARKAALRAAVAASSFPVDGISFEGRQVMLRGVPFEQGSDAERLRASIEIAMALNSKLRVIRVRDGSRLDEDNLALIAKIAAERDFQIWLERIDSSGKIGIVIEDGHIKGQDPEAVLADEHQKKARKAK